MSQYSPRTLQPNPKLILVWLLFATCSASILIAFQSNVWLVIESWDQIPSHAHGYVVLLVVAYLAWHKRIQLLALPLEPSALGLGAFFLSALAALIGELAAAAVVVQFSVIFLLLSALWSVLGFSAFRTLVGPLSFLFFAIPFGHDILPQLMDWTANATVHGLRLTGIPVLQQDRHFVIPTGSWSVVEACAGIRYLFTAAFIGAIYAYLTYQSWIKRVAFISTLLGLALFANWLRAYTIVLIAHLTKNEWGMGISHLAFGWIIFGVVVFVAFAVGNKWRDPEPAPPAPSPTPEPRLTAITAFATAVAILAFAINPTAALISTRSATDHRTQPVDFAPLATSVPSQAPRHQLIQPAFYGANLIYQHTFAVGADDALLYVAYYRNQTQGRELINVSNQLEPSKEWLWSGSANFTLANSALANVHVEKYTRDSSVVLTVRIYWINGFVTQSDAMSKLYQVANQIIGRGDDSAAIIMAVAGNREDTARSELEAVLQQHFPTIIQALEGKAE